MITLGIDCGTQSTKTIALDVTSGHVIASASQTYEVLPNLPPGTMEQNPADWVAAMENTIGRVLEQIGTRRDEVRGIGISGQQHGFVALDSEGRPIRPAKLWCDTSTAEECDLIRAAFGGSSGLIKKTGNDVPPGFTASKILWLKRHEPENFARLQTVLLPHDYLNFFLTGRTSMEYGDASGTALLDVRTRTWCRELVDWIDPRLHDLLPPLQSSRAAAGTLKPELAKRWGLRADVVVSAGGGDNMMGAIGTGNLKPGRVTTSLGTSGTIFAYSSAPIVDPVGEIAAFCDSSDAWLPLVCTMNVTVATEAMRRMAGHDVAELDKNVSSVAPGANGLVFLPYLTGERTPNLPKAAASLHGINLQNLTVPHLERAAMEGVTLGLAYGLRRLDELGVKATQIRLTGGGSRSASWRQICADVFGCPVAVPALSEGAALGGAIQALALCDSSRTLEDWADALVTLDPSQTVDPIPAHVSLYAELLERQTQLMRTLAKENLL
jgi:xylulokinase